MVRAPPARNLARHNDSENCFSKHRRPALVEMKFSYTNNTAGSTTDDLRRDVLRRDVLRSHALGKIIPIWPIRIFHRMPVSLLRRFTRLFRRACPKNLLSPKPPLRDSLAQIRIRAAIHPSPKKFLPHTRADFPTQQTEKFLHTSKTTAAAFPPCFFKAFRLFLNATRSLHSNLSPRLAFFTCYSCCHHCSKRISHINPLHHFELNLAPRKHLFKRKSTITNHNDTK